MDKTQMHGKRSFYFEMISLYTKDPLVNLGRGKRVLHYFEGFKNNRDVNVALVVQLTIWWV